MRDACVIGYGTVGRATAEAFGIQKYFSRSKASITLEDAAKCRYIFMCLPTPTIEGKCYTEEIYEIIKKIISYPRYVDSIIIIRSTVYPGFNRFIQESLGIDNIVSNPEFLSEDTAFEDAKNPDLIVLGGENQKCVAVVKALYEGRFKYKKIIVTDSKTAELIKYTLNTFFATKVIFANAIYDYAQQIGANYGTIRNVLETHRWGSKNHFIITYKGRRGIHGKCLPKDAEAFATLTDSAFFKILLKENERYQ